MTRYKILPPTEIQYKWVLVYALLLMTVAQSALAQPASAVRKIGVMLCLTGDCAEWGTSGLKGAQLAAEEYRAKTGKEIELVVQDSRDTTPAASVNALQKLLLDSSISMIVGPTWTVGAMPIAPILAKHQEITVVSPSVGVREFNESSPNIFNVWPHDEIATRALARYAVSLNLANAAVIGSQDPFYVTQAKIFREELETLGGKVIFEEFPLPDKREFKPEALRAKNAEPEFLIMLNYQADAIAKDLQTIKFPAPLFALQMEKNRVKEANGALEGVVFAMFAEADPKFATSFKNRFIENPGVSADTAYDAVKLLAQASEKTTKPEELRKELLKVKNYQGASGTFSIDEKRAVDKKPVLYRVTGLEYEKIDFQ